MGMICDVIPCRLFQDGVICDIVISASPSSPPLSVFILHSLLSEQYRVMTACHTHSSANSVPDQLKRVFGSNGVTTSRNNYQLGITLIWKQGRQHWCHSITDYSTEGITHFD